MKRSSSRKAIFTVLIFTIILLISFCGCLGLIKELEKEFGPVGYYLSTCEEQKRNGKGKEPLRVLEKGVNNNTNPK